MRGGGVQKFQRVQLLIPLVTYKTCDFPGGVGGGGGGGGWRGGPDPLSLSRSVHASSLKLYIHSRTYVFFILGGNLYLCKSTLHGYKKSARDQAHDFWRLESGEVKSTTFLVKRKFLFLRTI